MTNNAAIEGKRPALRTRARCAKSPLSLTNQPTGKSMRLALLPISRLSEFLQFGKLLIDHLTMFLRVGAVVAPIIEIQVVA